MDLMRAALFLFDFNRLMAPHATLAEIIRPHFFIYYNEIEP
jgi:hypothetical protein